VKPNGIRTLSIKLANQTGESNSKEAIEIGHSNVENDHVGVQLGCFMNRVPTIRRLTTNLPPFMTLEQGAYTVP